MSVRRLLALVLSCALILMLQASVVIAKPASSCMDPAGCIVIGPDEPVRLASLLVTELGTVGTEQAQAVQLATDLRGDIAGHVIQLVHLGDGCNPGLAATTAEAVAADSLVVAVVGATCSSVSSDVAPVLAGSGIMTVSGSSTRPQLTDPSLRDPFFFRFAYNDVDHGDALAGFLFGEGNLEAATVVDNVPSFVAIAERFADEFTSLGGSVTNEFILQGDEEDFSVQLEAIAAEETDAIVWITSRSAEFVTEARGTTELEAATLASVEGFQGVVDELIQAGAGDDAEGLVFSLPDISFLDEEPYLSELGTPFANAFGQPATAPYHAYAFDATNRLMDVIESFQGNGPRLTIPRTALRDAMADTTGYAGVSGSFTCDSNGDCGEQEFMIHIVVEGVLGPA